MGPNATFGARGFGKHGADLLVGDAGDDILYGDVGGMAEPLVEALSQV